MSIINIGKYLKRAYNVIVKQKAHKKSHDRAPGMAQVTIPLPEHVKLHIEHIARKERRKKTELMRIMLLDAVERYERENPPGNAHAGESCDAPGHCTGQIKIAAESRGRYGQ
jgi:predicted transcriptional regulator